MVTCTVCDQNKRLEGKNFTISICDGYVVKGQYTICSKECMKVWLRKMQEAMG